MTQSRPPVAKVCPNCSNASYSTTKPESFIAFQNDRICSKCSTRYSPPMPIWAGSLFFLIGLAIIGVFFVLLVFGPKGVIGSSVVRVAGIVIGFRMAWHGISEIRRSRLAKEVATWS